MKTSHFLILTVISLLIAGVFGFNLLLKKQFDKIDKTDPTYGFTKTNAQPFKYIKLEGKGFGLTEITQGDKPVVGTITDDKMLTQKVVGDTLILHYNALRDADNLANFSSKPSVFIQTPQLKGIISQNIRCKVYKLKTDELTVEQKGMGMLFSETTVDKFIARVNAEGFLKIEGNNHFGAAEIHVRDKSSLGVDKNVFKSFQPHVDSTARLDVPGSLLKAFE